MIDSPEPPLRASTPPRYDQDAFGLLTRLDADAIALIVLNGTKGSGFCVKQRGNNPIINKAIAQALRLAADDLEKRGPG